MPRTSAFIPLKKNKSDCHAFCDCHFSLTGLTLIELLIAMTLIGFLTYAVVGQDILTRHQIIGTERRAKLQNEISYCLDHMAKYIGKAIGDINNNPVLLVTSQSITVDVDSDNNGKRDSPNRQISYVFNPINYLIYYDDDLSSLPAAQVLPQLNTSTPHIVNCTFSTTENLVQAEIAARWDPAADMSKDNPEVRMRTRIKMPAVSIH